MTPNGTSGTATLASSNFGGGLIEIAALTALIGSTTAESLVLGNRGAAGLLWATMSIFGALSVIKACIAAATPGWLRETIGVRSKETDSALGIALTLNDKSLRNRRNAVGVCGVSCQIIKDRSESPEKAPGTAEVTAIARQDVYAFDQSVSGILDLIPDEESQNTFHILVPDVYYHEIASRIFWKDWAAILASTVKLVEVFMLWKHKALILCFIGGCSWIYFFCASIALQAAGVSRELSGRARERQLDVLAGPLPTPVKAGGQFKMLLGAPYNVRHSKLWRTAWIFGSLVSTASVITAYMALSSQNPIIFAEWVGFQSLWLALRSAFYHMAESADRVFQHPILLRKEWAGLSEPLRARVRGLVQTLSLYQMHVHPRGFYCYGEDDRTIRDVYTTKLLFPLSTQHRVDGASTSIYISGVLGDTLLSSASFVKGRKFAPLDKYDTCVVIIRTHEGDIAVPAARVMTGTPPARNPDNVETGFELLLPPKGGANRGKSDCSWWYWIPCEKNLWLEVHTTDLCIRGERQARVISGTTLTKHLMSGELYVSISELAHVEEIVSNSRLGFEAVQSLLR
ncbi:MAG: hypothetical protein Q9208_006995 [Pyrenodesmia sp. 3 TL-2023]